MSLLFQQDNELSLNQLSTIVTHIFCRWFVVNYIRCSLVMSEYETPGFNIPRGVSLAVCVGLTFPSIITNTKRWACCYFFWNSS